MPAKQDRQIDHIVQSEMAKGKTREEAESIAYGHIQNMKKEKRKFFPSKKKVRVY